MISYTKKRPHLLGELGQVARVDRQKVCQVPCQDKRGRGQGREGGRLVPQVQVPRLHGVTERAPK